MVFLQLEINEKNQGVHAFICQIRDADGLIMSESQGEFIEFNC
ncbi:hypothetical protein Patl1_12026 [Pistacia atlantica]|uniref:Uncharacterized protein n=1 Tax=Pistacia atlantica TaxID=434234 RepID=A0ACC1A970_9ROSI|nr:hypothetical protein Patl1_12026 [Pistacia atlantica]